jgi:Ankyrin repeats (3 copies)
MAHLKIFGFDWFSYTSPPLSVIAESVDRLKNLSFSLSVEKEQYISFVGFIDYFSEFSFNWQDDRGRTALHRAVADNDKTIVELLLDSKLRPGDQTLDLNIVDEDGYSPLGLALRDENHDIAARILDQTRH